MSTAHGNIETKIFVKTTLVKDISTCRMFDFFKVPVQPFTNKNEGSQGNYYYINRKYYPAKDLITMPGKKKDTNQTALRYKF
jgi:hypothetical protein